MLVDPGLQPLQPVVHDLAGNLVLHHCGGGARPRAVLERISRGVTHHIDDAQRGLKILLCLPGEANDEVAGDGDVGPRCARLLDDLQVAVGGVAAVHCLQDSVASRLHRQV